MGTLPPAAPPGGSIPSPWGGGQEGPSWGHCDPPSLEPRARGMWDTLSTQTPPPPAQEACSYPTMPSSKPHSNHAKDYGIPARNALPS